MKTKAAMWAIVGAFLFLGGMPAKAAEAEARPAELKVLDRWVGDWDVEIIIKPSAANPQGSKSTYKAAIRWVLSDRFIKCEAQGQGTAGERKFSDSFMSITTYDPQSKAYKLLVCWSNVEAGQAGNWGIIPTGLGTWDEKDQTMTVRSQDPDNGTTTHSVTQWIDKDTHRFAQSIMEKNGNLVVEWTGTAKRRK